MQRPLFSTSGNRMSIVSLLTCLVLVDVTQELLHPVLQHFVSYVHSRWLHHHAEERTLITRVTDKLWMWYWASLLTDLLVYPLETITAQLITQGLPMLVDDVNNCNNVVYLSSNCDGLMNFFSCMWNSHGLNGLFRGLSSLILQYGIQALLLYTTSKIAHGLQNRTMKTYH